MSNKKGTIYKCKTWCVEDRRRGIQFSVKCKITDLMGLFYSQYPNEQRARNINTFKMKYIVYSLTDKELENGIAFEEIKN